MRWVLFFLMIGLLTNSLTVPIFSDDFASDENQAPPVSLHGRVQKGLEACEEVIDLSDARISVTEVLKIYNELKLSQPQLFYVKNRVGYTCTSDGYLLELYPSYSMTGDALTQARARYMAYLDDFLDSCVQNDMKEWEKVLYIHDYLTSEYTYSPKGEEVYDAYGLFTLGHGVCQSFALSFVALGRVAGIDADVVTSDHMDHAWNHVKVDGIYYHVDVTRDLPTQVQDVRHTRFLLSDRGIETLGYTQYTCSASHTCHSSQFEAQDGTSLFTAFQGMIYPVPGGCVGWHSQRGLLHFTVDVSSDQKLYLRCSEGFDLDADGDTTVSDLILFDRLYSDIPLDYLKSFRDYLLAQRRDAAYGVPSLFILRFPFV